MTSLLPTVQAQSQVFVDSFGFDAKFTYLLLPMTQYSQSADKSRMPSAI